MLTPGNVSDIAVAGDLLAAIRPVQCLIADKGYDADHLRRRLHKANARSVIPGRSNRKKPVWLDTTRYKERWRIENAFCRLKDFRRIATRYDKLARNFLSAVALATIIAYWI